MDKCFACSNDADYILPCYHKICSVCLNDITDGVCHYYPDDSCDKQCGNIFEQDDILEINNNNPIIEICPIHNKEYTKICKCDHIYCDHCGDSCSHSRDVCSIEDWKKRTIAEIEKFKLKLTNKINGLKCVIEMIQYCDKSSPDIKQIEDIVDSTFVDISHIDNFNQFIDNTPISNLIKRKNAILNININIQIELISNPLMDYIKIIIENDGDIHANNDYVLIRASCHGNLSMYESLIESAAYIHSCNERTLRWACSNGHLAVVECLIKYGANIHANNEEALRGASYYGYLDVVKCLVSHGADIHVYNEQALYLASCNSKLAVVKCLVEHGADINAFDGRALKMASICGHLDVVKYLEEKLNI
jgi:ankyrin repeat protein